MTDKIRDAGWASGSWLSILADQGIIIDYETMLHLWSVFDDRLTWIPYLIGAAKDADTAETIKWIIGPLAASAKQQHRQPDEILPAHELRAFVSALGSGSFPRHFAKEVFDELIIGGDLKAIVAEPKFREMSGDELDQAVDAVIGANPEKAAEVRSNPKLIQWFVGQVLKQKKGLPPAKIVEILTAKLVRQHDERTSQPKG